MSPSQLLSKTEMETERANWGGGTAHCLLRQSLALLLPLCNEGYSDLPHLRDTEFPWPGVGRGGGELLPIFLFSSGNLEAEKGDHDPGSDLATAGPIRKDRSVWTTRPTSKPYRG